MKSINRQLLKTDKPSIFFNFRYDLKIHGKLSSNLNLLFMSRINVNLFSLTVASNENFYLSFCSSVPHTLLMSLPEYI